ITGCNWEVCVPYYLLIYDIAFIGPDAAETSGDFECDGPGHLFIDVEIYNHRLGNGDRLE
ncbi:MAG: hypothetical protein P8R45_02985, partial [Candidatus Binatia bacterium]|nr:hypothetical protein [Candidatus Binatia bacterium]